MSNDLEPIQFTSDYKPATIEKQIEALTRMFHEIGYDQRRGRIHPDRAHLRRWEIKSAVYTLKQLQVQGATAAPSQPSQ